MVEWLVIAFVVPQYPVLVQVNPVMDVTLDVEAPEVTSKAPLMVVIPCPLSVITAVLGIFRTEDQVQEPPGTRIVSPDEAELIANCTSL